jgi:hypothetical protein
VTAYFALWRVMFLLALVLELPIVTFASPREKRVRVIVGALVGNAITHPLLWFGWPRVLSGTPMLLVGETCAVVVEAFAMAWIGGIDRKRAFVISFCANFYSWGVGEIINRVVFPRMAEYLW